MGLKARLTDLQQANEPLSYRLTAAGRPEPGRSQGYRAWTLVEAFHERCLRLKGVDTLFFIGDDGVIPLNGPFRQTLAREAKRIRALLRQPVNRVTQEPVS